MVTLMSKEQKHTTKKAIYISLGVFFLGLAYIGIALPGFPAIPFIILSLFLFANSSQRLYNWMLRQKLFSKILSKTNAKKQNRWFRLFVISQLWVSISVAVILFVKSPVWITVLIVGGIAFSYLTYRLLEWLQE